MDEDLKEALDALQNMVGVFDTPVARRRLPGEWEEEARKIARDVLAKHGRHNIGGPA